MSKVKSYLALIRPPFLVATALSMMLGTTIAWVRTGAFDLKLFLLTVTAGVLIHAGTNASNDYFDHLSGNDDVNEEFVAPYTGGSRMIQLGRVSPKEVLVLSASLLSSAVVLGLVLAFLKGYIILILGAIGVFSGLCYAAPPIRLASRGVGEPLVGLNFGVLLVLGAHFVQTETIALEPIISSLPIAATITSVLWINEFPDFTADRAVGKNTLVVRLGKKRASKAYVSLIGSAYLLTVFASVTGLISASALIGLSTLPLAFVGISVATRHYNDPSRIGPACGATVAMHLLFVTSLLVGYLLIGVAASPLLIVSCIMTISGTSVVLARNFYRSLEEPEPGGP